MANDGLDGAGASAAAGAGVWWELLARDLWAWAATVSRCRCECRVMWYDKRNRENTRSNAKYIDQSGVYETGCNPSLICAFAFVHLVCIAGNSAHTAMLQLHGWGLVFMLSFHRTSRSFTYLALCHGIPYSRVTPNQLIVSVDPARKTANAGAILIACRLLCALR